ncbi:hypothetical protein D3C86_2216400 [compost metagenome]
MYITQTVEGGIWLVTSRGRVQIQLPAHVVLLERLINSSPSNRTTFYESELAQINWYINHVA